MGKKNKMKRRKQGEKRQKKHHIISSKDKGGFPIYDPDDAILCGDVFPYNNRNPKRRKYGMFVTKKW